MPSDLDGFCPLTTADALERAAALAPDIEAIASQEDRATYAELRDSVAQVRSALLASGIERGDHVAICLGNGGRWIELFLAIGSIGAVIVPVNTRFREDEIAHVLAQSRARLLVIAGRFLKIDFVQTLRAICPAIDRELPDPALPDLLQVVVIGDDIPAGAVGWDDFLARGETPRPPDCRPDDIALMQYTSGTTAYPKGVLLTHRSMCLNAFICGQRMGVRTADRFFSARPFFHVAGTTLSVLLCVQHAVTLVTAERFEPGMALELMETESCTHFSANDTIALMLLNRQEHQARRLALRGAWLAASPTVIRRVIDELGAREAVAAYGLSEASPNVAQSAWWEPEAVRAAARMRIQPGVAVRIRDPATGADAPTGQQGEILVRGWNVMRGYYAMAEETAAALGSDGWLSTGDLGRLDADGRLEFGGRLKEIIRVGGENVAPEEVEAILHRHPGIRQAVVVGVPDERLLEVPFAFVLLNEHATITVDEIRDWAKGQMAGFKVPAHVSVVADFEDIGMTASAKVQKRFAAQRAVEILTTDRA